MREKRQVFAVLRFEKNWNQWKDPQLAVAVTKVLPTFDEAEAEARRLNALNAAKGATYIVQATRYFPSGL